MNLSRNSSNQVKNLIVDNNGYRGDGRLELHPTRIEFINSGAPALTPELLKTVVSTRTDVESIYEDLTSMEFDINSNSSSISTLQTDLSAAQGIITTHTTDIQSIITTHTADISAIQSNYDSFSTFVHDELTPAVNANALEITDINTTLDANNEAISELVTQTNDMNGRLITVETQVGELQVTAIDTGLRAAVFNDFDSYSGETFESRLISAEGNIVNNTSSISSLQTMVSSHDNHLDTLDGAVIAINSYALDTRAATEYSFAGFETRTIKQLLGFSNYEELLAVLSRGNIHKMLFYKSDYILGSLYHHSIKEVIGIPTISGETEYESAQRFLNGGTIGERLVNIADTLPGYGDTISANTSAIVAVDARCDVIDEAILNILTAQTRQDNDITTNQNSITTLNSQVATNINDVGVLEDLVDRLIDTVSDAPYDPSINGTLVARITSAENGLDGVSSNVVVNNNKISVLEGRAAAHDADILAIEGRLDGHDTDISTITSQLTAQDVRSYIGWPYMGPDPIETRLIANESSIASHTLSLLSVNSTLDSHGSRLTVVEDEIDQLQLSADDISARSAIGWPYNDSESLNERLSRFESVSTFTLNHLSNINLYYPSNPNGSMTINPRVIQMILDDDAYNTSMFSTKSIEIKPNILKFASDTITSSTEMTSLSQNALKIGGDGQTGVTITDDPNPRIFIRDPGNTTNISIGYDSTNYAQMSLTSDDSSLRFDAYFQRIMFESSFFSSAIFKYDPSVEKFIMSMEGIGYSDLFTFSSAGVITATNVGYGSKISTDPDNRKIAFNYSSAVPNEQEWDLWMDDENFRIFKPETSSSMTVTPDGTVYSIYNGFTKSAYLSAYEEAIVFNNGVDQWSVRCQRDQYDSYLVFRNNSNNRGYVAATGTNPRLNFTGAHTCTDENQNPNVFEIGQCVYMTGAISSLSDLEMWEALPVISPVGTPKQFYGIYLQYIEGSTIAFSQGAFGTIVDKNDERYWVGAHGNMKAKAVAGSYEAGDYLVPNGPYLEKSLTPNTPLIRCLQTITLSNVDLLAVEIG